MMSNALKDIHEESAIINESMNILVLVIQRECNYKVVENGNTNKIQVPRICA